MEDEGREARVLLMGEKSLFVDEESAESGGDSASAEIKPPTLQPLFLTLMAGLLLATASVLALFASRPHKVSFVEDAVQVLFQEHDDAVQPVSRAPMHDFYMYRVQSAQDYSPENQNMGNIGGVLWYLHSEIVWHHWIRAGSFSSTPKTRIERFRVKTRSPTKLYQHGMDFGVTNVYDLGKCTGPFKCENLQYYGPAVGCEMWKGTHEDKVRIAAGKNVTPGNRFPHTQWLGVNHYPGAIWYSLPGACSSQHYWNQSEECKMREPSGHCPPGIKEPTGTPNCTYVYAKVGEITINEMEGIGSFSDFEKAGFKEYSRRTDKGEGMKFWDDKNSSKACQRRINSVKKLFAEKYSDQPDLADPPCDFDAETFYPHYPSGDF
eukprot:TRINITY_DN41612_c0_g1_i1.p1 TRINITY_DN41612_c0_g1~~TRINITY_DN41612_c0_g1_i1.p1  ORF type:complete len:403 (+),score=55.75 TRINITY_DN41612_c0_g1_i1:78-1211(+)